jgi:hypothetical protein
MTPARKRSIQVSAPLLASTALAILTTGCRQPEPKRCVDENNRVVDPSLCQNQPNPSQPGYRSGYWPYHFYYGGSGGFAPGAIVSGGTTTPLDGHSYSSSTTRGGFGSDGGDGGGGHGGGSGGGE